MLEIIVFVTALAIANIVAGIITTVVIFKVMFSDWFIEKYAKMAMKLTTCAMNAVVGSTEEEEEGL